MVANVESQHILSPRLHCAEWVLPQGLNDLWLLLTSCHTVDSLVYIVRIAALHIAVLFQMPKVILLE